MKTMKLIAALVLSCGVSAGCVADKASSSINNIDQKNIRQPQKNDKSDFQLIIKESHSDLCQKYVDYFNVRYGGRMNRGIFHVRNFPYEKTGSDESREMVFTGPDWKSLSYLDGHPPTPLTDVITEIIRGVPIDKTRTGRTAFNQMPSDPVRLFEADEDVDGDGKNEHLVTYRSDQYYNHHDKNSYQNITFVVNDDPAGFDLEKNMRLFPHVYEKDFLCTPSYRKSDIPSVRFTGGQDHWVFKYNNKFYFDLVSMSPRSVEECKKYKSFDGFELWKSAKALTPEVQVDNCLKNHQYDSDKGEGCKTGNFTTKFDLSNIIFIHEIANAKPLCLIEIDSNSVE